MVKLKSPIVKSAILGLLMTPFLSYGLAKAQDLNVKNSQNNPKFSYEFYNPSSNKFLYKKGGIDEKVINKHNNLLTEKEIPYDRLVDKIEDRYTFSEIKTDTFGVRDGAISDIGMHELMIKNFKTIKKVDETPYSKLSKKDKPLKKLLDSIDSIYNKNPKPNYKSLEEIYHKLGNLINPKEGKSWYNIEDVIEGKGGVCRDIVSTYYPLLTYYGYDVGFKEGIANGEGDKGLHVWLRVNLDGQKFALDPTWFGDAVPLEQRLPGKSTQLIDKFILKKDLKKQKRDLKVNLSTL